VFGKDHESTFGFFVRSLLGLEREAAHEAFTQLLNQTTLNANQIHFINMIIDMVCLVNYSPPSLTLRGGSLQV
jgi:type I restriction enzyme R subunit